MNGFTGTDFGRPIWKKLVAEVEGGNTALVAALPDFGGA